MTSEATARGGLATQRDWKLAVKDFLARWSMLLLLLLLWAALAHSGRFTPFTLPAPEVVAKRIFADTMNGNLLANVFLTLYRALAGFAIATVLGVAIGMAMSRKGVLRWLLDPVVSVAFPMPKITFLPVIVLWLGFYDLAKISMVVFDAIFPVITGTIVGIRGVEKELIWSARNMGAKENELFRQILLPAAMPQIMTGLQVALPISLIVAVIVEMMMGGYGMGGAMVEASRATDSPGVFAGIVVISIVGFVVVRTMNAVRRRLLLWHPESQHTQTF